MHDEERDTPVGPGTVAEAGDSELTCRQEDTVADGIVAIEALPSHWSTPDTIRAPFRCIRFSEMQALSDAEPPLNVINVSGGATRAGVQRELVIPLHEIKTKAFLAGRTLAIVSDGTQYGALERECPAIKASGVSDVIALLPTIPDGRLGDRTVGRMSPRDFVAERAYGAWHVVNLTNDALPPLLEAVDSSVGSDMFRPSNSRGLERTLIVAGNNLSSDAALLGDPQRFRGQVFVLDGGVAALRKFQSEASAMARALERPRIGERGCAG